jgi:hypothetical protein
MTEERNIETALFKLSNEIKARRLNIDARAKELRERQIVLMKNNEEQNEFAHKIWKGYKVLGIVSENETKKKVITKKEFLSKLEPLHAAFCEDNSRDEFEKLIAEIINLTTIRWNWVIELQKSLWIHKEKHYRMAVELLKETVAPDFNRANFPNHIQQIEDCIYEEECSVSEVGDLITELEHIYRIDKHLLDTAASLFEL